MHFYKFQLILIRYLILIFSLRSRDRKTSDRDRSKTNRDKSGEEEHDWKQINARKPNVNAAQRPSYGRHDGNEGNRTYSEGSSDRSGDRWSGSQRDRFGNDKRDRFEPPGYQRTMQSGYHRDRDHSRADQKRR